MIVKRVTEEDVEFVLPVVRRAIDNAVEHTLELLTLADRNTVLAAWQIALIEKASQLAKETFATSRVDFALAAKELYTDENKPTIKVSSPDDS